MYPFETRQRSDLGLETYNDSSQYRPKSRRKHITSRRSNLGPNGVIVGGEEQESEYRPSRRQVTSKREGDGAMLQWKVDEVRLRDNRPLSLKFDKKSRISPKITEKRYFQQDKLRVNARMEQIKRELRENMQHDVRELERLRKAEAVSPSKPARNFRSHKDSRAGSQSELKYYSEKQPMRAETGEGGGAQRRRPACGPSPNSRVRIDSRKEFLKKNLHETFEEEGSGKRNGVGGRRVEFCSKDSYFSSPLSKGLKSKKRVFQAEQGSGGHFQNKSFSRHKAADMNSKRTVILTPKRKKLLDEFKKFKMTN